MIWWDRALRSSYSTEYFTIGSVPGLARNAFTNHEDILTLLSQCQFLVARKNTIPPDNIKFACALVGKILQRGLLPLPTLGIEKEAIKVHGLLDSVQDLSEERVEMGWEPRGKQCRANHDEITTMLTERKPFMLDPEFERNIGDDNPLFDSDAEEKFISQWVPKALGDTAAHWFTPQASLDKLLLRNETDSAGNRRVDFLFYFPGSKPFAVEIDGPEHEDAEDVDRKRDEQLSNAGIDVLRVENDEVERGRGKMLNKIKSRCEDAFQGVSATQTPYSSFSSLVKDCTFATKVQFAVIRALEAELLQPRRPWTINLTGVGTPAMQGIADVLDMLSGIDELYGMESAPSVCTICSGSHTPLTWRPHGKKLSKPQPETGGGKDEIQIRVDTSESAFHSASENGAPDIIIRPAYLPVKLANVHNMRFTRRPTPKKEYEAVKPTLEQFLRHIFRKFEFRPLQGEAICNVLQHNDSIVLLPTGAGKSIIYQIAGLLMPGVTLVIDPLVSLIDDQIEGMARYGIDHTAKVVYRSPSEKDQHIMAEDQNALILSVERGENQFVLISPERMQAPRFRRALLALAEKTFINMAVIDEAHCVSEWGHDFRPAYLNLPDVLRKYCKDKSGLAPPVLALTGTASRVVLRDVLRELHIDENNPHALFRPASFDRKELGFEIVRTSPTDAPDAALRGTLYSLPEKLGYRTSEMFGTFGRKTASGIIFVPTVKDRLYGIFGAAGIAREIPGASVATYSGSPPRSVDKDSWEAEKRENARRFKNNEVSILVATKAFGMGIDKPNIRHTIHFGMPGTLENFYQEVGRAGRDGKRAHCTVIFSEFDRNRSDRLLDLTLDIETLRERHNEASEKRKTGDDITRALWFHLQGFRGTENEIDSIRKVLDSIEEISETKQCELGFVDGMSDGKAAHEMQEQAICRLVKLGVVDLYEKDFGARKFALDVHKLDYKHYKRKLYDYIRRAQPAKSGLFSKQIEEIPETTYGETIMKLAEILINFTYETIELSRRRMIQEAMRFARQSKSDAEIRRRILEYLQEGLAYEDIIEMAEATDIDLLKWVDLLEKPESPLEAGDLRGTLMRVLNSYPDHPGLLISRAVAESMCADFDYWVCRNGLDNAYNKINEYGLGRDLPALVDRLFAFSADRKSGLAGLLTFTLLNQCESAQDFHLDPAVVLSHAEASNDENAHIAVLTHKSRCIAPQAEGATTLLLDDQSHHPNP